ncbi:MAG: type IX secretion system membrane protein PorP/SprF, partial [Saprospiraceae bacterium]|nr:type IX secretion system membrane protein PorP/SprF [Saprospiraceae bacterium]
SGLPLSLSIHGGAEVDLVKTRNGSDVFVSPNFQYIRQGALSQLNIGTIFRYYKIGTGAWYRHASTNPDALIFLIEGRQDNIRIAYSYDFTLSKLTSSGGAHEISFMIVFRTEQKESRYNDCFNLFR